jgi:hypothetical protein
VGAELAGRNAPASSAGDRDIGARGRGGGAGGLGAAAGRTCADQTERGYGGYGDQPSSRQLHGFPPVLSRFKKQNRTQPLEQWGGRLIFADKRYYKK